MKLKSIIIFILFLSVQIQSGFCLKPDHKYIQIPSDVHLQYDSLNIKAIDNVRLTAWLCKPTKVQNNTIVILASSDAGNMSYNMGIVEGLVQNLGINVLMFDYRGFGTSDHIDIDTDLLALPEFATDLHSVVTWVQQNIQHDTNKIVIYGRSMGASLAITCAATYGGIGGVIAESPYATQQLLNDKIKKLYTAQKIKRNVKQIESKLLEPLTSIDKCHCKLLLIHGQEEDLISSDEIYYLYKLCGSKHKSLWIASNAGHLEVPYKEMNVFFTAFQTFLSSE